MASEGPNFPTAAITGADGDASWSSLDEISAADDTSAVCSLTTGQVSDSLVVTEFGFAIPSGATIDGVVVGVRRQDVGGFAIDDSLSLWSAEAIGLPKLDIATWPTTYAWADYGTASDVWSATLTPAIINDNTNWGCALRVTASGVSFPQVDTVRMTVHYTEASTGMPRSVTVVRQPYHPAMFEE
jgi:hypothetical protein